jgi:hypothetical protein
MKVTLDKFEPRDYQIPIINALEQGGYKRIICIWPRRAGKDLLAFNLIIRAALKRVGIYYYVFPTFSSGRRILWEAITNGGFKVLDYIPPSLIKRKNESTMFIELINGSLIKIIGSDNYDKTLVGTNVCGVVFSEYAIAKPESWEIAARPIIANNDGFAIFVSTPRGRTHLFDLVQTAYQSPQHWYVSHLTVEDTGHMRAEELEQERKEMSKEIFEREYMCSFNAATVGLVYSQYVTKAYEEGRITTVPYDESHPVHTAWDIGLDTTAIVFFQLIGSALHVIDYWEDRNKLLHQCVKAVKEKDYFYGHHLFPHDGKNRSWEGENLFSRQEKARQLGLDVNVVKAPMRMSDAIEHVRITFKKIYIDEKRCERLIRCLENYTAPENSMGNPKEVHNWASHGSSAFKIMCIGSASAGNDISREELERNWLNYSQGEKKLPYPYG